MVQNITNRFMLMYEFNTLGPFLFWLAITIISLIGAIIVYQKYEPDINKTYTKDLMKTVSFVVLFIISSKMTAFIYSTTTIDNLALVTEACIKEGRYTEAMQCIDKLPDTYENKVEWYNEVYPLYCYELASNKIVADKKDILDTIELYNKCYGTKDSPLKIEYLMKLYLDED